jgi:Ca2+/H+ antiporter, TMEM165/GDT1 family
MESFLISTSVVALAEIGDKTQLLSLFLAARYRRPFPIVIGVFAATFVNHSCSGALGVWLAGVVDPKVMNWLIVASFALMAVWILVPDKFDATDTKPRRGPLGVLGMTAITFFLAEMGDKTQIVTIAMAAHFHEFAEVVAGTTLGMMLANVPVIYLGHRFANRLPAKAVHALAALIFVVLGGLALRTAMYPDFNSAQWNRTGSLASLLAQALGHHFL